MKANELRAGNIVYQGIRYGEMPVTAYEIHKFTESQRGEYCAEYYKEWKPITLTPEWLIKLGLTHAEGNDVFDKYQLSDFSEIWHTGNGHFIEWESEDFKFYIQTDEDVYFEVKWVEYVHQLQNLYFALTGEELTALPSAPKL